MVSGRRAVSFSSSYSRQPHDDVFPAPCVVYGYECTYDTAQDRRRPVSKAYVTALEQRVNWLEQQLRNQERGTTRGGEESSEEDLQGRRSPSGTTAGSEMDVHTLDTGIKGSQKSVESLQVT